MIHYFSWLDFLLWITYVFNRIEYLIFIQEIYIYFNPYCKCIHLLTNKYSFSLYLFYICCTFSPFICVAYPLYIHSLYGMHRLKNILYILRVCSRCAAKNSVFVSVYYAMLFLCEYMYNNMTWGGESTNKQWSTKFS